MRYLVDTDWVIDVIKGIPSAVEILDQLIADGVAVSIISFGELYEGAYGFPDPDAEIGSIRDALSRFAILNLTELTMETFARLRALLRRQGMLIPDLDLLIASTALSYDLTLLSRNRRHFQHIPDLKLYQPT